MTKTAFSLDSRGIPTRVSAIAYSQRPECIRGRRSSPTYIREIISNRMQPKVFSTRLPIALLNRSTNHVAHELLRGNTI